MKRAFRNWPILARSLMLGLLPMTLIALLLGSYFLSARLSDAQEELMSRGAMIARQFAPASEYAVLTGNVELLNELVRPLLMQKDVMRVTVRDKARKVLYSYNNPALLHDGYVHHLFRSEIRLQATSSDDELMALPLGQEQDRFVGLVEIELSEVLLHHRQERIVLNGMLFGLGIFLLSVVLAQLLSLSIVKPVRELNTAVAHLGEGDLDYRVEQSDGGELGELESGVNAMAASLRKARAIQESQTQELLQARENADRASRAKTEFLRIASHELRAPLTSMMGMLDALLRTSLDGQQRDHLRIMRESGQHLLAVIHDMLDYSSLPVNGVQVMTEVFSVGELGRALGDFYRADAIERHLALHVDFADDLRDIVLSGDMRRIRQVLVNLVGVSLRDTERGHVTLQCDLVPTSVGRARLILVVADSGAGQWQKPLEDLSRSTLSPDTDMALSVAQRLVEQLGGVLSLEHRSGEGNHFRMEMDIVLGDAPQGQVVSIRGTADGRLRALVVEDNPTNQLVAVGMLQSLGCEVAVANDGQRALELVRDQAFSIIFMDCQMPVLDGYETTRQIRELEMGTSHHVPIVALTANALDGARDRCLAAGMDDFLAKPFKKSTLAATVARWTGCDDLALTTA